MTKVTDLRSAGKMHAEFMLITPEMAEQWLRDYGYPKNRTISREQVFKLVSSIISGRWSENGETIVFGADGRLLNGHHRLSAIVQAKTSIRSLVVFGITDPNAFKSYDHDLLKRSTQVVAGMMDIENSSHVVPVARRLMIWEQTQDKSRFELTQAQERKLEYYEVLNYSDSHQDEIRLMIFDIRGSLIHKRCKKPSALITALIICSRANEQLTGTFIHGLKNPGSLSEKAPGMALRDRLIDPPDRGGHQWETEIMALVIKSWNKHVHHKEIRLLKWAQGPNKHEPFPIPGVI